MSTALTKLFISSQKHLNALQTILDYEQHKETMNKFEHKIKSKRYSQEQIEFYLSESK